MPRPLLYVAAHDAGGAEIIAAWLARYWKDLADVTAFYVQGPAERIFEERFGRLPRCSLLEVDGRGLVLCGTSGKAALERIVTRAARQRGLRTVAWLDHYKNFSGRFGFILPNELWVTDSYADKLARQSVFTVPCRVMGNPYLDEQVSKVLAWRSISINKGKILYLTEPGRLALLQQALDAGRIRRNARFVIRVHPAEALEPYAALRLKHAPSAAVRSSFEYPLWRDIAWADVVIGAETQALMIAAKAGKRTISSLPPNEMLCLPPEYRFERLSQLQSPL